MGSRETTNFIRKSTQKCKGYVNKRHTIQGAKRGSLIQRLFPCPLIHKDANGFIPDELEITATPTGVYNINSHTRDKLEAFIADYNKMYNTKYSTKDSQAFYNYYTDISKRVKNQEVDILLVVNMFLTGFDSQTLNTLYVDKNLKSEHQRKSDTE